jgi:integrase
METVQPIRDRNQIKFLIDYFQNKSERNYIMFMVGIHFGLRISDILKLKVGDVKGDYIKIREEKTGKIKRLAMHPELRVPLKNFIKGKRDHEYLIKSRQGLNRAIDRSTAYRILNDAASLIGLKEIGTHTMRKTMGYTYYMKTKDIATLQKLFNHRNQTDTLRYIGIQQEQLDEALSKISYR